MRLNLKMNTTESAARFNSISDNDFKILKHWFCNSGDHISEYVLLILIAASLIRFICGKYVRRRAQHRPVDEDTP